MNPARALKRLAGTLDYRLRPAAANRHRPFNDQAFRRRVVGWIIGELQPTHLVETGTHRGSTTEYLARRFRGPIHGIEIDERYRTFARLRLRDYPWVQLHAGDSVAVLPRLLEAGALPDGAGFYYLDAHGGPALPLAREIELILGRRPDAVAMADDFQVPDDPGYGFDDHGPGRRLTVESIEPLVGRLGLRGFLPDCPAAQETGARRGSIVLARHHAPALARCPLLREWRFERPSSERE